MIKFTKTQIEKHPKLWEVFKYLLIGGIGTIIDFLTMGTVIYFFDPEKYGYDFLQVFIGNARPSNGSAVVGTAAGSIVGLIFTYILSIVFVFNSADLSSTDKAKTKRGFALYTALSIIGISIHIFGMMLFFEVIGINEWVVKISLTFVSLVYNFVTRKLFVFKRSHAPQQGEVNDKLAD